MNFLLQPWQLYLVILAGWINRQQQEVIEYLRTENRVLKEKHGGKRLLLNDDQRRRLAVKGQLLGRKRLEEIGTLFTPDTILRWHRMSVLKGCWLPRQLNESTRAVTPAGLSVSNLRRFSRPSLVNSPSRLAAHLIALCCRVACYDNGKPNFVRRAA